MRFIIKKSTQKFFISLHDTQNYLKKNFFLQQSIRMNGKSINFDDKKINKSTFYKNKKLFYIHDLMLIKY